MPEITLVIAAICLIACFSGGAMIFKLLDRIESQQISIARAIADLKGADGHEPGVLFGRGQKEYEEALNSILNYSLRDAYIRKTEVSD